VANNLTSLKKLYEKGVEIMLRGTDPITENDWERLTHFWAYNLDASSLPNSLETLSNIFRSPLPKERITKIGVYYQLLAFKRQDEMLKKLLGQLVTPDHLKHLRSIMSRNLQYEDLVKVFKKSGLEPSWPQQDDWTRLGKLCKALFSMTGEKFKTAQTEMAKIVNGGKINE